MTPPPQAVRDWHATYLTDPGTMTAARRRAAETGEDGWAAAATLAISMPPASFASIDAFGAREILYPSSVLNDTELDRLGEAAESGYYVDRNLTDCNHDLAASMSRPADPGRKVRPDLPCPRCCEKTGRPEETGVQLQEYRCPQCHELWKYVPPVDPDAEYSTDYESGHFVDRADAHALHHALHLAVQAGMLPCPGCMDGGAHPDARVGQVYRCPGCGRRWGCAAQPQPGQRMRLLDSTDEREAAQAAFLGQLSEVLDLPGHMLVPVTEPSPEYSISPGVLAQLVRAMPDGVSSFSVDVAGRSVGQIECTDTGWQYIPRGQGVPSVSITHAEVGERQAPQFPSNVIT
jgi:transposase-like protein